MDRVRIKGKKRYPAKSEGHDGDVDGSGAADDEDDDDSGAAADESSNTGEVEDEEELGCSDSTLVDRERDRVCLLKVGSEAWFWRAETLGFWVSCR